MDQPEPPSEKSSTDPSSVLKARELLATFGAQPRLARHGEIVAEVAAALSREIARIGVEHDEHLVAIGAVVHDIGKVACPEELVGPGHQHEAAGERLLLSHGLSARLAAVCRTHGAWSEDHVPFEDRLIALSDHLWKGTRSERLELLVTQEVADRLGVEQWEAFVLTDSIFEQVASGSTERLSRART